MTFNFFNTPSQNTNAPQPSTTLFGQSQQKQPSLFFGNNQNTSGGTFGQTANTTSSIFGNTQAGNQQQQPSGFSFGQPQNQNQNQQSSLGASQQPNPQQGQQGQKPERSLQLGQAPTHTPPIWEEGKGLAVYRTIPAQIENIHAKWSPNELISPLRTYLYRVVPEDSVPFYQPGPGEDEHKWEEAVSQRPASNTVPALVRGFHDLGKRAQRNREFVEACNIRLHEINRSLDAALSIHGQKVSARLQECRRRHSVAGMRVLRLAAKIQNLRNRGYVLDNAEEELRTKLVKLEREVFDPTLNGREQEIWARMLGIRERAKRLKQEMGRVAPAAAEESGNELDEETVKAAKKVKMHTLGFL